MLGNLNLKKLSRAEDDAADKSEEDQNEEEVYDDTDSEEEYIPKNQKKRLPTKFTQEELSDLIRELGLPKDGAELLASRLKDKNLLSKGTKVSIYRNRDEPFRKYFIQEEGIAYCTNITGLMNGMKPNTYRKEEWRLFMDSSKYSMKAVLLHNTNVYVSLPILHSVKLKESYDNMEIVLNKIKYSD